MARTKGMLNLSGNLEVNAGAPLDARSVVPTVADLTVAANFQYKYVGMPVVVQATGDMYVLTANDVTVAANWKQIGSGGGGTTYTAGDGIVIENDEISTDNMPAADMAEIVNPLPSVGARYHTYSEDEQIVAYWEETVNGVKVRKPVYEKTINYTAPAGSNYSSNTTVTIATIATNLNIKNVKGVWSDGSYDGNVVCYGNVSATSGYYCQFDNYVKSSGIVKLLLRGNWSSVKFSITLQYTKTTD